MRNLIKTNSDELKNYITFRYFFNNITYQKNTQILQIIFRELDKFNKTKSPGSTWVYKKLFIWEMLVVDFTI